MNKKMNFDYLESKDFSLPQNRQDAILKIIKQEKSVSVKDLAKFFYINEATIRRDFNILESTKLIKRIHGGAVLIEGLDSEIPLLLRETANHIAKNKMGLIASKYINDGDTIFLDSSSSISFIIPHILNKKGLKIITNGAKTIALLAKLNGCEICCTGGKLRENSLSFIGLHANNFLENYYIDKCFFSCRGVSIERGITELNQEEAELRKIVIRNSRKKFLLADNTKFDAISYYKLAPLDSISAIITDTPLNSGWEDILKECGTELICS